MEPDLIGAERLSGLIDRIYACVLDRKRWRGVLEELCDLVGGCAASLNIHDLPSQAPYLQVEYGTDPVRSESYVREYAAINPLIEATLLFTPQGAVNTLYRVADLPDYRKSRFYLEWVAPQGWGDWMSCVLTRTTESLAMLAVARLEADGPYSDADTALMRVLMPHLERSAMLGRLFEDREVRLDGVTALLGRIRVAAFLLERSGRIAYANPAGRQALGDEAVFLNGSQAIGLAHAPTHRRLYEALADAASKPFATAIPAADGPRILTVLPASADTGGFVLALLTLPADELPLPGSLLMEAYGLTPAEVRVLVGLLKRRSVPQIAVQLGITQRTVKAHLQRLFEKTGADRQSTLAQEVLSRVPPMRLFE